MSLDAIVTPDGDGSTEPAVPASKAETRRGLRPGHGPARPGRRRRPAPRISAVGVIGELFVTAGVGVLLFLGWQLWINDYIVGTQAQQEAAEISQQWQKAAGGPAVVASAEPTDPADPVVTAVPANAQVYGTLIVPRFGADWQWPLAEGVGLSDVLNLRRIGHYPGTQMPGEVGNAVLAGHRTGWGSPFIDLNQLQIGDAIYVETEAGWYRYVFRSLEYVLPTGVGVLDAVPQMPGATPTDRILTLTSCNPLHSVSERLIAYSIFDAWYPRSGGAPAEIAGLVQASAAG